MKDKNIFSKSVNSITEAQSIYLNQLVYELKRKGEDVITLSLGEAFLIYLYSILIH